MKCNFNVEDLIKYTENLLSDEDKERVLEHLNSCEKCRRHYGVLKFTETYAKDSLPLSENISKNVMEAIDMNRYSKNKKFWLGGAFHRAIPVMKPVLAVTAAIVVVSVGVANFGNLRGLIFNPSSVGPSPTNSVNNPQNTNAGVLPESTNAVIKDAVEKKIVTLYYANSNADKVVAEKREVEISIGTQIEKLVFEELQKKPKSEGLRAAIPKGTKLLSASTEGGILTLNLSREFVDNSPGGTAGELMTLYSIINTMTELPDIKKVQFLIEGQKEDIYIHAIFDEPFVRNEEIIEKDSGKMKAEVEARSQIAVNAIKGKDMQKLASLVHPVKGVLFSPYSHINLVENMEFKKEQLSGALTSEKIYYWGEFDGIGDPIKLTFAQYYEKFVYDQDFANAEKIAYNEVQQAGNTLVNIAEVYPEGKFIDYYFSGFNPDYGGMDWASLRLVFEKYDGQWYLVCIAHGQWTI